ncbi:MAG TPA: hypothetical protein VML55_14630, partial [Planctomycetaceae bacterium]|nr:hypothetical protein [Planctomycetaceae bacterium]
RVPIELPPEMDEFLDSLALMAGGCDLPDEDTPLGRLTREFFGNNWGTCRDGLLARTQRIRVRPDASPWPRVFQFEIDCPFKRKLGPEHPVELMPGPIRGTILYRPDLFRNPHEPALAVRLPRGQAYFHPNYSRTLGLVCLGDVPPGPFPLDALLENHLYPILSYQNRRPSHPADFESARYFALDPEAMSGLEPVRPLY